MPNGERSVLGGQVIIERIGREDGGEYQCWDLVTNKTNTHKYVNVLCKYDLKTLNLPCEHSLNFLTWNLFAILTLKVNGSFLLSWFESLNQNKIIGMVVQKVKKYKTARFFQEQHSIQTISNCCVFLYCLINRSQHVCYWRIDLN